MQEIWSEPPPWTPSSPLLPSKKPREHLRPESMALARVVGFLVPTGGERDAHEHQHVERGHTSTKLARCSWNRFRRSLVKVFVSSSACAHGSRNQQICVSARQCHGVACEHPRQGLRWKLGGLITTSSFGGSSLQEGRPRDEISDDV